MSPYQQQVIDTTLEEFDRQAQMQEQRIADQAVASGAFGGGRQGVLESEFSTGVIEIEHYYKQDYYNKDLVKHKH